MRARGAFPSPAVSALATIGLSQLRQSRRQLGVGPLLAARECLQWRPITHRPPVPEGVGEAALSMRPPGGFVVDHRLHIGGSRPRSSRHKGLRCVDEHLDAGGRQGRRGRAGLLLLARHGFVQEERCSVEVERGDPTQIPHQLGTQGLGVPVNRRCRVGDDQHDRQGGRLYLFHD